MTTKFTPAPWYPGHLGDDTITCNCRSICDERYTGGIATVHLDNGIASIADGGNDSPPLQEAVANMNLIAAAPEMYRVIEDLLARKRGTTNIARKLLAKARGEISLKRIVL